MKKSLLVILLFTLGAFNNIYSISYVSAGVGPADWHTATSWTPNGIPGATDDVTISAGHEITISARPYCNNFTCSGNLRWLVSTATNGTFTVKGDYNLLAGGSELGTGYVQFNPPGASVTAFGTTSQNVYYSFYNSRTITAGSVVNKYLTTIRLQPNVVLTNLGTVHTGISVLCSTNNTWTNGANSSLLIRNTGFMAGHTFNASASGNIVFIKYFAGNLPTTVGGIYASLRLIAPGIGAKKLVQNTIIQENYFASTNNTLNTNSFNLSVAGSWTSNGALLATTGNTITFNGTSAQSISNTVGTTTFTGLTIDNNAGVTFTTGSYVIDEVLTLSNGTLNTGGRTVVLTSTATKTARIAPVTGTGAVSGNFTVQRFILGRDTTYCDLSSPVNNSTFLDWDNELPAISYIPPVSGSTQGSASTYDETGDVYVAVTSSSQPLLPGQGFEVYLAGSFSYAAFPTTTLTTVGEPTVGDQDFSSLVSANVQGWNLVGNPFASSISWASVYAASGGASSGLFDYIEMFDYTINDWADVTADDEIASTQGFWVYSDFTTTPSLFILESCKTNTTVFDIRAGKKIAPYFTLKLANSTNTCAHNFKVAATSDAFDGYDRKDLPFRNSPVKATPAMYAMVDGKKINTNTFNSSNDSYSMPLKTQVTVNGTYKITASGFEYVADYTCIKLQDKLTGQIIDLNEGNGYCFTMNTSDNPDRFILLFSKDSNCKSAITATSPSTDFSNQVEVLPSAQGNVVYFNLGETTNTTISVLNVLGQTIVEGINLDAATQSVNITLPADFSGLYFVKIESTKGTITKKFVRK